MANTSAIWQAAQTIYYLLAVQQEPYKKAQQKIFQNFLQKSQENGPLAQK